MALAETIVSATPVNFWLASCAGITISLFSCYWSFRILRHTRIMEDTPTSRIRSAAQGYTELEGVAKLLEGEPIISPLTGNRCAWYSVKVEERSSGSSGFSRINFSLGGGWESLLWNSNDNGWSAIRNTTSDAIFELRDETGSCIVDPEGADVRPATSLTWYGNSSHPTRVPRSSDSKWRQLFNNAQYRYTEKRVHGGDPIYVIGMFLTLGADHHDSAIETEIRDLLACWKRDKTALLQRFDLNQDGQIDPREWEVARKAARKTVEKSRKAEVKQSPTHVTRKPLNNELPFILSAVPQHLLIKRKRRIAALCNIVFLIATVITAWAFHIRFWQTI